ncbi:hypothetical protein ES703_70255 [subsurface metagenome]
MPVTIGSETTLSVEAYTKTADLATGQYENVGPGKIILVGLPSATGMNVTLSVGGVTLINDQPFPWFGTSGAMDLSANVICAQQVGGGKIELFFRNTTVGALTIDYQLMFEPTK